jgi:hypothetical protein
VKRTYRPLDLIVVEQPHRVARIFSQYQIHLV